MGFLSAVLGYLKDTFCPPPLSPLFQEGGIFYGLNEDLTFTLLGMAGLFVVDNLIVKRFIKPKARYFALHALGNAVCVAAAAPDMYRGFSGDPRRTFSGPSHTMVANSVVAAIHLYHCVAFPLRSEDIFHHVTFVSILCGMAIPFKHFGGIANNFGCFFLSGLPGGIDYAMLVAVAQGWMDKMTEKKYCAALNVWMRGPSMAIYSFLGWMTYVHYPELTHPVTLTLTILLHYYNGQYYNQQAVESYAVHKERARVAKEAGKSVEDKKEE